MNRPCRDIKKIIMHEMEIVSLHKRCNKKARKVSQPKKASGSPESDEPEKASESPKSDEPKKVSGSPGLIDDPSEEGQKPKKASRSSDGKKTATKAEKYVKKTSQPKTAPKSLLLTQARERRTGCARTIKGKNASVAGGE